VESRRRTSSGSGMPFLPVARRMRRHGRSASSLGSIVLIVILSLLAGASPAAAQQDPPPGDAQDAAQQLEQVNREAEALTEEWHAAKDTLAERQQEVTTLQAAVQPAKDAVQAAVEDEERYRIEVDGVALSTFESGNLDQLNALLASRSPQEFLDRTSAL
jgi:peptidoglycan DL-endopeptidase CwlO